MLLGSSFPNDNEGEIIPVLIPSLYNLLNGVQCEGHSPPRP